MESWQELSNPRDLTKIFQTPEYAAWRSLRESDDSRYIGLAMPRFLARLPYGVKTNPVDEFDFEEDTCTRYLIVAHDVVNLGHDRTQLASMATQAKAAVDEENLEVLADRGYYKGPEILACEQSGITPFVPITMTSDNKARTVRQARLRLSSRSGYVPLPCRTAIATPSSIGRAGGSWGAKYRRREHRCSWRQSLCFRMKPTL